MMSTQKHSRSQQPSMSAMQQPDTALHKAEADYYDCLADFGHNSGEALAARRIWHSLRNRLQASTL